MKEIKAIIQPFTLNKVIDALREAQVGRVIISDVRGFGQEGAEKEADYTIPYTQKIQLQTVVSDEEVDKIVKIICEPAYTGRHVSGKIFVYPVEKVVRILTGQENDETI